MVVGVVPQIQPEDHAVVTKTLTKAMVKCSEIDCFIYDRNCFYSETGKLNPDFKKIKWWPLTKLHAHKHNQNCPMSHLNSLPN